MEGSHGELSTRLSDGLGCNDTDCFTDFDSLVGCIVSTIALLTYTMVSFTGKDTSDENLLYTCILNLGCKLVGDELVCLDDDLRSAFCILLYRVHNIVDREGSCNLILQCLVLGGIGRNPNTVDGMTVFHGYNHILGNVYQLSCKITGTGCLQCCICKTLSCTVGGEEEFDDGETFLEVGLYRKLNVVSIWLCHDTSHGAKLGNLL